MGNSLRHYARITNEISLLASCIFLSDLVMNYRISVLFCSSQLRKIFDSSERKKKYVFLHPF